MEQRKTPSELGWKEGDKFEVISGETIDYFKVGEIVILSLDDNSLCPLFTDNDESCYLYTDQVKPYVEKQLGESKVENTNKPVDLFKPVDVLEAIKEFCKTEGDRHVILSYKNTYTINYHGMFEYIAKSDERLLEILAAIAVLEKE